MSTSLDLRHAAVQLIEAGDGSLAHRVVGEGPDVVFVHGWPLHGMTWRNIVPLVAAAGYRCHVFDLPGTGSSKWSTNTLFSVPAHARRIEQALTTLGLASVALVGHNSGSAIARYVAGAMGASAWANVVAGSEIPDHHPLLLKGMLFAGRLPGRRLGFRTLLRTRVLRHSAMGFGACFVDLKCAEGEFHRWFAEPLIRDDRAFAGQMGLVQDWDWAATDNLREVHTRMVGPSLLLWGDGDPYFPVDKARAMAAQLAGGATFHSRADGKLFVHEEHPAWFAEHMVNFFADLAP